jgi:hypothetical protein
MRRLNTGPCHDFADNAGDFDHPGDGRITTTHARRQLVVSRYVRPAHASAFTLPAATGCLLPDWLAISFAPTLKETLRVGRFRSSPSLKASFSPALLRAIA